MFRVIGTALIALIGLSADAIAQNNPAIDSSARTRTVEDVAQQIEDNFYDSTRGAEIASELRIALSERAFDGADDAASLSDLLTSRLRAHDNHFSVRYLGPPPERPGNDGPGQGQRINIDALARANFGFQEVAILPGNVGYIDLRQFAPAQVAGDTALAALNFVANTDAVIFDVRNNGGGAPSMVQFLISHFLDPMDERPINTFVSSARDYPSELMSLSWLPGQARPDVPLYVLTSGNTGSAGEAFPYHLQAMERATIVGETTYGAGNPGGLFPAGDGFAVFVSTGSARNPITGTNWEGTGVIPDVETSSEAALNAALMLAYDAILETADDPGQRQSVEWALEAARANANPMPMLPGDADALAGTYGPRSISIEDGRLYYRRGDGAPRRLTPVGEDRFLMEGLDDARLTFQRGPDGGVVSLTVDQLGRRASVSPRTD
tara:strand:- start:25065 stop:26375 length:1311 start_codon:yes stop_codon:yes gene_type:complete